MNPKQAAAGRTGLCWSGVDLTETAAGVYNERQKVELSLEKTLELSEEFGIGNNNELVMGRNGYNCSFLISIIKCYRILHLPE